MKRRTAILFVIAICAVGGVILAAILLMGRHRYEGPAMVVTWVEGIGQPLSVEGTVLRNGAPVGNRTVNVETGSGGNAVTTGPDGRFSINVGELELTAIEVEGGSRIDWGLLSGPRLRDGVRFRIELK
jgi:hypothetical protein